MGLFLPGESVVGRLVSKLTVIALAAHLLAGCCWHHAHACGHGPACTAPGDIATADCPGDHCGHEGHCADDPGSPVRHGPADCEGADCVFLSERSGRTPATLMAKLRQIMTAAALVSDPLVAESNVYATAFAAGGCCPSLRPYLVNQVLLL